MIRHCGVVDKYVLGGRECNQPDHAYDAYVEGQQDRLLRDALDDGPGGDPLPDWPEEFLGPDDLGDGKDRPNHWDDLLSNL